jgi:excisionase family DNA binding protein
MEKVTMDVKELAKMVGVSLPRAYDLTEVEGFPVIRMGRRKIILVEEVRKWLKDNSGKRLW